MIIHRTLLVHIAKGEKYMSFLLMKKKKENKQWLYIEIYNYLINIVHTNNTIYDDDDDHDHNAYNDIGAGDDDGESVVIRKGEMTNKIYSSIHIS